MQSWTIDKLKMEKIDNPWIHLANLAGQGSIKSFTVERGSSYHQSVKDWVKEEVEAVEIRIDLLHFNCGVQCETDEEVKTLCTALAPAQQWGIRELYLPGNMGAESYEALRKVGGKGNVDSVTVMDELWWNLDPKTLFKNSDSQAKCCRLL